MTSSRTCRRSRVGAADTNERLRRLVGSGLPIRSDFTVPGSPVRFVAWLRSTARVGLLRTRWPDAGRLIFRVPDRLGVGRIRPGAKGGGNPRQVRRASQAGGATRQRALTGQLSTWHDLTPRSAGEQNRNEEVAWVCVDALPMFCACRACFGWGGGPTRPIPQLQRVRILSPQRDSIGAPGTGRRAVAPDATFSLQTARWFDRVKAAIPRDGTSIGGTTTPCFRRLRLRSVARLLRVRRLGRRPDGRVRRARGVDGRVVPNLSSWRRAVVCAVKQGHEPLHATVVVVDGKGVAFFGDSGWGKSTLAASFIKAGHSVLTDDLLVIREVDGVLYGFPGPSRIKLFLDVARRFQPEKIMDEPIDPDSEKARFFRWLDTRRAIGLCRCTGFSSWTSRRTRRAASASERSRRARRLWPWLARRSTGVSRAPIGCSASSWPPGSGPGACRSAGSATPEPCRCSTQSARPSLPT